MELCFCGVILEEKWFSTDQTAVNLEFQRLTKLHFVDSYTFFFFLSTSNKGVCVFGWSKFLESMPFESFSQSN